MHKNTNFTLFSQPSVLPGDNFENLVDKRIAAGTFKNATEVIRAGLRLSEEKDTKIVVLKKAIRAGINSGVMENFNAKKYLAALKSARKKNG